MATVYEWKRESDFDSPFMALKMANCILRRGYSVPANERAMLVRIDSTVIVCVSIADVVKRQGGRITRVRQVARLRYWLRNEKTASGWDSCQTLECVLNQTQTLIAGRSWKQLAESKAFEDMCGRPGIPSWPLSPEVVRGSK